MLKIRIHTLQSIRKAKLVCALTLLFIVIQAQAQKVKQEYTFKHYTIHDGLPQMQVMSLFQDSKGYLWCSTKAGLSRFDGKHFKNYTSVSTNLSGFDISIMSESKGGNLLISGPSKISALMGDSILSYPLPNNITGSSGLRKSAVSNLQEVLFHQANQLPTQKILDYRKLDSMFIVQYNPAIGKMIGFHHINEHLIWQANIDSVILYNLKSKQVEQAYKNPDNLVNIIGNNDCIYGISNKNSIYKLDVNGFQLLVHTHPNSHRVKVVPKPDNSGIIIKTEKDLLLYDGELKSIKTNLTSIRDIIIDNEDNLWVATEEGLYNFFQLNFVNYTFGMGNKDWVWSVLEDNDNNFWFASYQNGLWKWDGKTITDYTKTLNSKLDLHLKNSAAHKQYRYYMGASKQGESLYFPTECNVLKFENKQFSPVKNMLELPYQITKALPDGNMIFAGYAGLFQQNADGEIKSWSRDSVGISSILNVEIDEKNRIVAVGKDGVALVSESEIQRFQHKNNLFSYATAKDHNNNIWIGGMNNVSLYNNDTIVLVSHKDEEAFYSLLFVAPHYLFLGGIKGLYVANLAEYYTNGTFETVLFNQSSGFTGIEAGQNGFFTDSEGMVWIPTSDLVTRFDPNKLIEKEIKPPSIYLNCEVSEDNILWKNQILNSIEKFSYTSNNLHFKVDIISFSNAGNVRYYYKLEGLHGTWLEASEINEITFYNLKPGKYTFKIKADAGVRSAMSETLKFNFEIKSPFWKKWWFILLNILFLGMVIYLLVQHFRKREQQKAITKQRLTQLRSEALSAQLDPHFVMNCLNNISGLVNAGYKKQANEYIVKFSRLLRIILQSVKKESISLNNELEMVRKYMDLEQFRCNDCFSYKINTPQNYSTEDIMVPPMMLQPLVENSIKHGFGNTKMKDAQIEISIKIANRYLYFSIADNGKGLKTKTAFPGTGLGTKITKERIELLQKNNNIEFTIEDIKPGVKVSFKIPLILSKV